MEKKEFNKLNDYDKLRHVINKSIATHKTKDSEFWKGSKEMAQNILQTMNVIDKNRAN